MSFKTVDYVKYFLSDSSYTVGDNSTLNVDGINDTSYEGEIVIKEKIEGKEVVEIAQYSLAYCRITKVTIHAKLRSINTWAFCYCTRLEYINIPSTVTLIGAGALYLGDDSSTTISLPITVEFNEGRTQNLLIYSFNFADRSSIFIIYPSNSAPVCPDTDKAFKGATTWFICAHSVFDFYTKTTTKDQSKCPSPKYKNELMKLKNKCHCTCNSYARQICFIVSSLLVSLFTRAVKDNVTSIAILKKIE